MLQCTFKIRNKVRSIAVFIGHNQSCGHKWDSGEAVVIASQSIHQLGLRRLSSVNPIMKLYSVRVEVSKSPCHRYKSADGVQSCNKMDHPRVMASSVVAAFKNRVGSGRERGIVKPHEDRSRASVMQASINRRGLSNRCTNFTADTFATLMQLREAADPPDYQLAAVAVQRTNTTSQGSSGSHHRWRKGQR